MSNLVGLQRENMLKLIRFNLLITLSLLFTTHSIFGQQKVNQTLHYLTNEYMVTPSHAITLDSLLSSLLHYPEYYQFKIDGHTDNVGSELLNEKLSENRANAVKNYVVKYGVNPENITTDGKNFQFPVAPNSSPEGKALNRRVEIFGELMLQKNTTPLKDNTLQAKISNAIPQKIKIDEGTELIVDAASFENLDGSTVTDSIELQFIKVENPVEMIGSVEQLNWSKENDISYLNSTTLFTIKAFSSDKVLKLKEGKNIELQLKTASNPQEFNLYQFDAKENKWIESKKIKTEKGFVDTSIVELKKTIQLSKEEQQEQVFIEAMNWLKKGKNTAQLKNYTKTYEQLQANDNDYRTFLDSTDKYIKNNTFRVYFWANDEENKIIYIGSPKTTKKKKIGRNEIQVISRRRHESEIASLYRNNPLHAYFWKFNPSYALKYSPATFQQVWTSCEFIPRKDGYRIVLKNDQLSLEIPFAVPMKIKNKKKKLMPENLDDLKEIEVEVNKLIRRDNAAEETILNENKKLKNQLENTRIGDPKKGMKLDSVLKAEWSKSVKGLDKGFFDNTISQTNSGYIKWLNELKPEKVETKTPYEKKVEKLNAANDTMPVHLRLKISQLGDFSCSTVEEADETVVLNVKYKDPENKKEELKPAIVYVLVEGMNSVWKFDGSSGYSPKKIAVPKDKKSKIILFKNNVYYVVDDRDVEKKKKRADNEIIEFSVEKINVSNTKELNKLLQF